MNDPRINSTIKRRNRALFSLVVFPVTLLSNSEIHTGQVFRRTYRFQRLILVTGRSENGIRIN